MLSEITVTVQFLYLMSVTGLASYPLNCSLVSKAVQFVKVLLVIAMNYRDSDKRGNKYIESWKCSFQSSQ